MENEPDKWETQTWVLPFDAYGVRVLREKDQWFLVILAGLRIPLDPTMGEQLVEYSNHVHDQQAFLDKATKRE